MTFNSFGFALFLPLVYLGFRAFPARWRWTLLLAGSYACYASLEASHLLVALGLVTLISHAVALKLRGRPEPGRRNVFWLGIGCCVTVLALVRVLANCADTPGFSSSLAVTVGVSYFTVQAISYLADVYLELVEPEPHLGYHALALAFFPKLMQGPIERAGDLLPQLKREFRFDYAAFRSGLLLFAWGLFRKVAVADRLGLFVDRVYGNVFAYSGLPLWLATYAYALQVYFDLSGYTDMARGTARLFGVELTANFNQPYFATSVADFWRRWHISFSRFLLDYLFRPLQLCWRDAGKSGVALALVTTFLISGLWHGASWTFVVWGGIHGIYLAGSVFYRPLKQKLPRGFFSGGESRLLQWGQMVVTFNLVCFAWIFFRADSLDAAFHIVRYLWPLRRGDATWGRSFGESLLLGRGGAQAGEVVLIGVVLAVVLCVYLARDRSLAEAPVWVRWPLFYALILAIVFLGAHQSTPFIYFQF